MTNSKQEIHLPTELQFELKYCERCGGLWLRPMGGQQIYCGPCWREMRKHPRASQPEDGGRKSPGTRWDGDEGWAASYDEREKTYRDAVRGAE